MRTPSGPDDGGDRRPDLTQRARTAGAVLWASFLAACAGTMFFFAYIAPEELLGPYRGEDQLDRIAVYTLGFFGLWCLSALASVLTLYLQGLPGSRRDTWPPPGASS